MRRALVIIIVIIAAKSGELSCSLQAARNDQLHSQPDNSKVTKQLRRKSSTISTNKQQNTKGDWQINFNCKNSVRGKDVSEKFVCAPEYNKLKFVFIQNRKVSSIFIDLQPSLISFNKFVGLDLKNLAIRAEAGNCEIWIESSNIFKALVALLLTWFM